MTSAISSIFYTSSDHSMKSRHVLLAVLQVATIHFFEAIYSIPTSLCHSNQSFVYVNATAYFMDV